jgi:hypothetical protein
MLDLKGCCGWRKAAVEMLEKGAPTAAPLPALPPDAPHGRALLPLQEERRAKGSCRSWAWANSLSANALASSLSVNSLSVKSLSAKNCSQPGDHAASSSTLSQWEQAHHSPCCGTTLHQIWLWLVLVLVQVQAAARRRLQ